jgi:hypothetical protein
MDICRTTEPPTVPVEGRGVKCHLYTDMAPEPGPVSMEVRQV